MPVSLPSKHRWRLYSLDFRLFFQTVRPVVAVRELQPRAVEREWSSLMSCRWLRVAFFDYAWLEDLWSGILALDSMMPHGVRKVNDLTPKERELGERWRRFRDQPRPADKLLPREQVK
jgi:hypothetical protein